MSDCEKWTRDVGRGVVSSDEEVCLSICSLVLVINMTNFLDDIVYFTFDAYLIPVLLLCILIFKARF